MNKYNELAADLPDDVIKVAESGVFGAVEVEDYARAGADAVLVARAWPPPTIMNLQWND